MLELYKNIKKLRLELGMSQDDLAKKTGYTDRSSIAKIEKGNFDLPQSKILLFAKALGVSAGDLMGYEGTTYNLSNILPIDKKVFPLLGSIACGKPIFATDARESYIVSGTEIHADFCLKCKGDSMINARINDGDFVFIREQHIVDNGEIAAVIINNEATLKRVFYYPEKKLFILKAENPAYEDLIYSDKELDTIKILGKAIAFQSDVK